VKRWYFWLGLSISVLFLWQALRSLRLAEVGQVLRDAQYLWLIPGIAVYFLAVWARSWRWHYLLRPLKQIPTMTMFPIVAIGYMGNNIYPARAGELLRAYILRDRESIPIAASLATIVIERAFDGIVMLAFVFLNISELMRQTGESGFLGNIRNLAIFGAAFFLMALIVFLLMALYPTQATRIIESVINIFVPTKFRDSLKSMSARFLTGLSAMRSPADIFMVLSTSVVIWLFETGKYWFLMQAFPFEVSFYALMLMNGIVNLATTIPSAPGYIGTFDAPGIAVLEAYGVPGEIAAGYTLALHAALLLPITLLGAYFMTREQLSWQKIKVEIAQERAG